METYHKIQTLFKRDMDGSRTGQKGKMIRGEWTTPELEYLADKEWSYSAKIDGTNIRIGYDLPPMHLVNVQFGGRTDSAVIPTHLNEYLREKFTPDLFENAGLREIILFGEGYGPKIQNGGKYRNDPSFILFDVKIGDFWLSRENVADIASKLGLDVVPEIGQGTLFDAIELVENGLQSQFGDFYEEGLVCRPLVDLFDRKGQRIICKVKHVDLHSQ